MGTDVYQSRFGLGDLVFIPIGFPKRCDSCYHRFYSWKSGKKRDPNSTGKSRNRGSGEIRLPSSERDTDSGNLN
jgi:hypothetical protein